MLISNPLFLLAYPQDYASKASVNITYGCTEMLNAERFLEQLRELGKLG